MVPVAYCPSRAREIASARRLILVVFRGREAVGLERGERSKSRARGEREADHRENRKTSADRGAAMRGGAKCEAEQSDCDEHEAQVERGEGEGGFRADGRDIWMRRWRVAQHANIFRDSSGGGAFIWIAEKKVERAGDGREEGFGFHA